MLPAEISNPYPEQQRERDRWILAKRAARNPLDPFKPQAFLMETELAESGQVVPVATIFLTNRECPWRCLMCDLWKNTLAETVPIGAIPSQIDYALRELRSTLPAPRQIKLYNSGSFFDKRAIPQEDYVTIAERVRAFERVVVECHPALLGELTLEFRDVLKATDQGEAKDSVQRLIPGPSQKGISAVLADWVPYSEVGRDRFANPISHPSAMSLSERGCSGTRLEVAMGLETAHPQVLEKLNKRMTLDQFRRAAEFLRENDITLRVFVLVKPPFLDEAEALDWAKRSIDFAFDCGATAVSLIPTRFGNGALEALARRNEFSPPELATLEAALDYGIGLKRARVFTDLWDLEKFSGCNECFEGRRVRIQEMNLRQIILPRVACECCRVRTT